MTATPSFFLWTIGCQMNKAESERLISHLRCLGFDEAATAEEASLVLLNTCVVRRSAEERTVNKLALLKGLKQADAARRIAVTGCFVGPERQELQRRFPHVDFFFGPGDLHDFAHWASGLTGTAAVDDISFLPWYPGVSSFVPIMQGCDNFCTYCIVPYRRGRERSRPLEEVRCEVECLVQRGSKEVTLVGQNVNSYGRGLPGNPELPDLLVNLSEIDALRRLRFLTNHPKDMSPRLIETMAALDKVCEHLNLPAQSGDDDILRAMGRGYTVAEYLRVVDDIRRIPGLSLSTDIIVGFPGETAGHFQNTLDLLARTRFDAVHVAAYSPRAGTIASKMLKDDVPAGEKKRRLLEVEALQEAIASEINKALVGRDVEVLVEGEKDGKCEGRTRSNKLVFFPRNDHNMGLPTGEIVRVRIEKATAWSLQGNLAEGERE